LEEAPPDLAEVEAEAAKLSDPAAVAGSGAEAALLDPRVGEESWLVGLLLEGELSHSRAPGFFFPTYQVPVTPFWL
jgi:hypothetical protein